MLRTFALLCTTSTLAASLPQGESAISGVIVDADNHPVARAVIRPWESPSPSVRSGKDGRFDITLHSASFRYSQLMARNEDGSLLGTWAAEDADQATVKYRETVRIVLRPAVDVRVIVKDAEDHIVPQAEVGVDAYQAFVTVATTGADGSAHLLLPSDVHVRQVLAVKAGVGLDYVDNTQSPAWKDAKPVPAEITLRLRRSRSFAVKVTSSAGKPLAGIAFCPWTLFLPDRPHFLNVSGAPGALGLQRVTDQRGIVTFDYVPADLKESVSLLCFSDDWHQPEAPAWNPAERRDEPMRELETTLLKVVEASGRVLFADGQPASGILLQAEGRGSTNDYCRELSRTLADGSFRFALYPEQSYLIAVTDLQWSAPSISGVVINEDAPHRDLTFFLSKGTLVTGIVTDPVAGNPLAGATITFVEQGARIDPSALRAVRGRRPGEQESLVRWATTDAQGRYQMRVGQGDFKVSANNGDEVDLHVANEPTLTLDFKASPRE